MNETTTIPAARGDFRFFHRLRVRWAEVDMQKIVFNAHYLMYFDTAISDYWRALAMPYEESMQALGGDLYVRKATLEFHASARMDDLVDVAMKCRRIGNSSMVFDGALFRGDALLVGCELVYVFADPATQTSRPVPPAFRAILEAWEAGEPVYAVRTGDWQQLGREAGALRRAVFVKEQRVPEELEWDEFDATALHAVARNKLGRVVGTARLVAGGPKQGRIGRMAVHRVLRGGGIGADVLQALEDAARTRGDLEITLHAQLGAQPFYRRAGYAAFGEPFVEAGIAHIEMRKAL
ncbi:MAG: YbgC/FadM family acyl-CoA thioesterase [Janthinobacterium lividum]